MQNKLKRILSEEKIQEIKIIMLLEKKFNSLDYIKEDKFIFLYKLKKIISLSNS